MKMKRTVALSLSALLMLTLFLALPIMPAKASGTPPFTLEMGNTSTTLFASNYTQRTIYIDPSFNVSFTQEADSWCEYNPTASPRRLTLIKSATVNGYIAAANGDLDIYINNGVTLTLNATNNIGDRTECVGIRMQGGALSFYGASGDNANKGTLIINNANTNAGGTVYTLNAAIYAKGCPSISLSGGCAVTATGGNAQTDNSYGVYLYNENAATALSLAGGSSLTASSGNTSTAFSYGVAVYSWQDDASIHVSGGSRLTGTARDSSNSSFGVRLTSGANNHMLVENAGSKLTGTGGNASSGNSYGICLESYSRGTSLLEIKNGGEVTGTGGNGFASHGVYMQNWATDPFIRVEQGGTLTGTGGASAFGGTAGWSYGVCCLGGGIAVSGKLAGIGGDVTPSTAGQAAYSYGVYCNKAITVDGGELTGQGGAATAKDGTAETYGVTADSITLEGDHAVLEGSNSKNSNANGDGTQLIAKNIGVCSQGAITVGATCELVGSAGPADANKGWSYSYGVYSAGTIDVSGSLTGNGDGARGSYGVYTENKDITVSGSLTGTSDASSGNETSYGVNVGKGKVAISGTVNAAANGASATNDCIGVSGGIELMGSGHLIARSAGATPTFMHCAKRPKTPDGQNALTAGADAVWRDSDTAAFELLAATYDDTAAYKYLEVQNSPGFKVTPASASVNAGTAVTLTANGVTDNDDISWYMSNAKAYGGATELTGKKAKTLTFTPESDHNTKYYFAKLVQNNDTIYSNIVPVTANTYGIELSQKTDYRFRGLTVGYQTPESLQVKITNTGNAPTGKIIFTLSGANADSFTVGPTGGYNNIETGSRNYTYFYVQSKENLAVGTYTAKVTAGPAQDNPNPIIPQSFNVTLIVAPVPEVTIQGKTTIVRGESTTLTAVNTDKTGTGQITYLWSTGGTDKFIIVTPDQTTDYSVTVTDDCNATGSASTTVTVEPIRYGLAFAAGSEQTETIPPTVDFGTLPAGYAQPGAKTIIVQNTGNVDERMQALKFSPALESSYTVVKQTPWDDTLPPQGTKSFTIQPNANLAPGTYNTTITIPCDDSQSTIRRANLVLLVKFTVVEPTYAVALTMTLDSAAYSGQTVSLKSTGADYALTEEGASGVYKNAAVHAGSYTVYSGGVSTGETLTVTGDHAATLAYYTVSFEPNGGTPAPAKQLLLSGRKASAPAAMQNGALSFGGWYQDEALTAPWTFATDTVTKTLTLRAKWTSAPAFAAQPTSKAATLGAAVTFTVEATGVPTPTYQWQLSIDGGATWSDIQGATGASYVIPAVTLAMNGQMFRCVATNAQGSAVSDAATLTVFDPNAEIVPRDHFEKGDAPALTVIVGHGLPGLTVNNLSGVAVTIGGTRTSLIRDVHYEASTGGSIHIVPKQSWLNTLKPGDYPVDITLKGGAYEGMHVYTRFTVTAPTPATGDNASPALWICLMAAALLALGFVLWKRRKA